MDSSCNFKIFDSRLSKTLHVYALSVECHRYTDGINNYYFYSVIANTFGADANCGSIPYIRICDGKRRASATFDTPKEAFDFLDKVAEKYPKYGDVRDYNIELAPVYEGVEI